MKICYLSNSAIPSTVANAIQTVKMCEAFSELNNEVTLITTNVLKTKINLNKYYNIKFKFSFVRIKSFNKFPLGIKYYLFSIFSILESFKYKPDIYITRNFFTCFLLTILRRNTIIELHHDLYTESRIVSFLVKKFKFLNSKYLIKIIAITHGIKKEYVKNNFTNEAKIIVLPSGSSIKKNFVFSNNKKNFKIGYFGSLYESRGLNLIKDLAKIDSNNQYYIYGDFNNIKNFNHRNLTKNLHMKKYIPYKDIANALAKMDILLIPYVSSITVAGNVGDVTKFTSPLKLFDYLSVGKIIMCSDFKVLREVIKDKENVIFIKNFKNKFSWRNEINKLRNQPQKQFIMSKNNYQLSKKYSLRNRAKIILKLIG